jgi:hypothetical protein
MILNTYGILDGFVSLLRLGLGGLILALGLSAWRAWRRRSDPEGQKALEDRRYLLFLLGGLLLGLNVLSWPLFYLLLQSYVPEWPGVMCIYGVTQVGSGSVGPSRFLPALAAALQAAKPILVFLSGAWFVLYLVNRRTPMAPLTGRVLLVLLTAGLLGAADAAAELAYLAIPKKEEFLSAGCCTVVFDTGSRTSALLPRFLAGRYTDRGLYGAYYAVNGAVLLGVWACARLAGRRVPALALGPLLLATLASVAVNALFLVEVAAPRLIRLPYHHCPYDLVPRAPESLVAVALFVLGWFFVGWACVAGWLGRGAETRPFLPGMVRRLLQLAFLGYLWSLVMLSVELARS